MVQVVVRFATSSSLMRASVPAPPRMPCPVLAESAVTAARIHSADGFSDLGL